MKKIFVFGNPDLEMDSLPLRILPELKEKFKDIEFEMKDPNEEWAIPSALADGRPDQAGLDFKNELIAIDTVVGIKEVAVFEGLDKFSNAPRVGVHDFDALANLKLLKKLGKIGEVKVIAVPPDIDEMEAVLKVSQKINKMTDKIEQ